MNTEPKPATGEHKPWCQAITSQRGVGPFPCDCKPAGEWTSETIVYWSHHTICDAHNAAVAAEREKHCKDCCCARSWEALGDFVKGVGSIPEHIEALKQQLAAERERHDSTLRTLKVRSDDNQQLRAQLAAIKEEQSHVTSI